MPRLRVIADNDYSGDPDGLFQLAHHALSPSIDLRLVIGSHLSPGDPFDDSDATADHAADRAREVLAALGLPQDHVVAGSNTGLTDRRTPADSAAARAIVTEAMRDDADRPLVVACGAGLTEIASAWLLEPRIADRLTVVWIGGAEYPGHGTTPPGAEVEYNTAIDVVAAQVVFNDSDLDLWQVPRNVYRQVLLSQAELDRRIRPLGATGALLADSIDRARALMAEHGLDLGETYAYGDSPLVLLTALQSAFQPDPSSSESVVEPAPRFGDDGSLHPTGNGRAIRVFTRLDTRLLIEDLVAKLEAAAAR